MPLFSLRGLNARRLQNNLLEGNALETIAAMVARTIALLDKKKA
jgi:hypothetical protein